jgi:hypothetical protein
MYLRLARVLLAMIGDMKIVKKIYDFGAIIQKTTKFSKKVKKSLFFSVTN